MSSVDQLVQRLGAEVTAATERIRAIQAEATTIFFDQEKRFTCFMPLADRILAILESRLAVFMGLNIFKDVNEKVSLELRGPKERGYHGSTTTLSVPPSDACSGKVELSFRLGHDGPIKKALIDYGLAILPIFIQFEKHDQLVIPIDKPDENAIASWIDDKLVGFTRTYFEMYFTEQYQMQSLETDPVMNIRFPKAFAAGKKEFQGKAYHFYTNESLEAFENAPSDYVAHIQ